MVLKVVTGKILETLELRRYPTARSSVLELRPGGPPEAKVFALRDDRLRSALGICAYGQIVKDRRLSYR